jgi:hypothetical protein
MAEIPQSSGASARNFSITGETLRSRSTQVSVSSRYWTQIRSELGRWRKAALIWAPESPVADPYLLKKIPRPTPLRFWLDDHGLALFSNEHFRSIEPIILWKPDRL